jgi:hypothetical protein
MIAPVLHETPNGWDRRILRPLMTRPRASALLVSALVLVAAACSEDGAGSSATQPAEASPSSVPTDGSIYVSGHDHVLNSMLYRLDPGTGHLTWVGDARTASTAADSVLTRFRAASILRRIDELDGTGLARTSMTDLEIGCSRSSTTTQISTTSPPSPDNRPNGSSSAARSIDRPSRTDVNRVRGRVAVHH